MKQLIIALGVLSIFGFGIAKADTVVVIQNGAGQATQNSIDFTDASGTYIYITGNDVLVMPQGGYSMNFAYTGTLSQGSWQGTDNNGNVYTATLSENYVATPHRVNGAGRGGHMVTVYSYSLTGGSVSYDYPNGIVIPPPQLTTLNTTQVCNADGTLDMRWDAAPNAVIYAVMAYDPDAGWLDLASGPITEAPAVPTITADGGRYTELYIASYDANGVETDWDQQAVSFCAPVTPPTSENDD